ncbi:MAG TPA: cupin domain-containing protein [Cellulomonas sp.]|uniref:cupin domain-containing protein n=1 Tax=Cellulomonas sp. TaxID=40001 RepID=UPI002E345B05|nr:cupin domain-containing protein [Cellulomonas sp.]HEX5332575.1 cupin domain-containing protein [Cellulomonas sp.]
MRLFQLPRDALTAFGSTAVSMDFLPRVVDGSECRVTIAHLDAGGILGRHPATLRQMFAVVAGTGEVEADGLTRAIGPGTLVVWEPGEVHQTRAGSAMTAIVVEVTGALDLDANFAEL